MKVLGAVCCLAVVLMIAGVLFRDRFSGRRESRWFQGRRTRSVVCIDCQGRGWIDRQERTLTFTGDGFADTNAPATPCAKCGGTGRVIRH